MMFGRYRHDRRRGHLRVPLSQCWDTAAEPTSWEPAQPAPVPPPQDAEDAERRLARVEEQVDSVAAYLEDRVLATASLVNPLLDLWSAANDLHPSVRDPLERLLVSLVARSTVGAAEVRAALDETRAVAVSAALLVPTLVRADQRYP